jgi:hypothetical protein
VVEGEAFLLAGAFMASRRADSPSSSPGGGGHDAGDQLYRAALGRGLAGAPQGRAREIREVDRLTAPRRRLLASRWTFGLRIVPAWAGGYAAGGSPSSTSWPSHLG